MNTLSVDKKYGLSIKEASEYFGIGETSIRDLIKMPNCQFVLKVGKKYVIKREKMAEYLNNVIAV